MQVKEVMSRRIIAISPEETVAVAARLLSQHNIGALPVCSRDGRLRGMVTDRDIVVRCVAAGDDPERTRVAEIMTRRILAAEPDRSVDEAARLMAREQVRRLPVQEHGGLSAWCRWAMSLCGRTTRWRQGRSCRKFRRISAGSSRAGHPAPTAC